MIAPAETNQRIARLTPLADVLARIDTMVMPSAPSSLAPRDALSRRAVLAADTVAAHRRPDVDTALTDGFAVDSSLTLDASSYAPMPIAALHRIAAGERLPAGTDAVAPFDAVQMNGDAAEIIVPVVAGTGVLAAGADMAAGTVLRGAGETLRPSDIAVLTAAGVSTVQARVPQVRIVPARQSDVVVDAAVTMIAELIEGRGGRADIASQSLETALKAGGADAVIVIGGTGTGPHDDSVRTLARIGRVEVHGVGVTPGETSAFGMVNQIPVLLIPGRLDAVLAVFVTIGSHFLTRLTGAKHGARGDAVKLSRKITSTIGLAEFVPLRRDGDNATPLGIGHLPWQALMRADGWLLVPPDSEGYPAGTNVRMRAWP